MAAFYSRFYQEAWGAAVLSFFVPMDDALEHMAALWDGKKKKKNIHIIVYGYDVLTVV